MKLFSQIANALNYAAKKINMTIEALITLSLVGILGFLMFTVVSRYIFQMAASWVPELISYLTAFIGMFGFSCLVHRRTLLSITFLRDKFPPTFARVFNLLVFIGIILYFRIFIVHGIVFVESVRGQFTPSMTFRMEQVRMIMPIGASFIVFQAFNNLIQDLNDWVNQGWKQDS